MRSVTGEETQFKGNGAWSEIVPIPPEARYADENVCMWLLYAPAAHPMWAYHVMYVIDLSYPDLNKQFPSATHEIGILALNPERQPYTVADLQQIMRNPEDSIPYMTPPDFAIQLSASEEQVKLLAIYGARASAEGKLIPDSDYALSWERSLRDTLQHLQTGGHDR